LARKVAEFIRKEQDLFDLGPEGCRILYKKNKIHVIWPERLLNYIRKEQDVFNLGPKGCRI